MSAHENTQQHAPLRESALDQLLLAESEAAARLVRARTEAEAIVELAKADVASVVRKSSAAQVEFLAALDAAQLQALADIEREVTQSAVTAVARYENISAEQVERLAATVLADVLGQSTAAAS